MSEFDIQNALYRYVARRKKHEYVCPNTKVFRGWEADLVSVTKAGLVHEFEIKRTKADYKRDFDKEIKHNKLKKEYGDRPSYFWYACPYDMLIASDLPDYAGLIYVTKGGTVTEIKRAPRLHERKLRPRQKEYISRGLMYRYWDERTV